RQDPKLSAMEWSGRSSRCVPSVATGLEVEPPRHRRRARVARPRPRSGLARPEATPRQAGHQEIARPGRPSVALPHPGRISGGANLRPPPAETYLSAMCISRGYVSRAPVEIRTSELACRVWAE